MPKRKLAHLSRRAVTKWIAEDPEFSAAVEMAKLDYVERLEIEADRRGTLGITEPIYQGGEKVGVYKTPSKKVQEQSENFLDSELVLRLTGFKDPVDRQYQSKVSILEQGEVVKTGLIEVNQPLVHRGVAIYQTAYNQDEFGFWYSGFQLSKDPGEPLVWGGSILLIIGLYCAFSIRHRALAVIVDDAAVSILPLTGFGDERGQRLLERWSSQKVRPPVL